MGNWLGRLIGSRSAPAAASVPPRAAVVAADAPGVQWQPALDVDVAFCRFVFGQPDATLERADAEEQRRLDTLAAQVSAPAAAALVPRVPAVVPQLLHSLRDPARPMSVLARQLAQDPVLVAGVLKLARSPFYGLQRPVTSLEQALLVIGQDGLRQMLASLAFKPIINLHSGAITGQGAPRLWDQSERCGLACQVLAPALGGSPFEAFLAALLESVGMVVVMRLLDQAAPGPLRASTQACHALTTHARALAVGIGRHWSFPDTVIAAVTQGDPSAALHGRTALGDLVRASAQVSKLRVLTDAAVLAADDPRLDLAGQPLVQRCFQMLDAAPA